MTQQPESRRGLIHGATAYGLWGLLPLYFHLLDQVDAGEIVAQRVLWSVALLVPIVLVLMGLGMTIGNLVGGLVFVAIPLYLTYGRPASPRRIRASKRARTVTSPAPTDAASTAAIAPETSRV